MKIITLFFLIYTVVAVQDNSDILCSPSYCDKVKCKSLPEKCKIQNATHNGIFTISPETCNCCEYCLENLGEGELCSIGNPANPAPTSLCGPGLYCQVTPGNDFDGTCSRMNTGCTQLQDDYDKRREAGTLGSMETRQTCDDSGLFSTYKCIPGQTCYCVDKEGNRIFGEAPFTPLPEQNLQCKCSRGYIDAAELIGRELNPTEHFRCSSNGDYNALQCFNDKCLCVDTNDGAPTYPDDSLVNITLISKETLKCYKHDTKGIYYTKCEQEYIEILKEVTKYKKEGYDMIFKYTFPKCDIDGTYQSVQENSTHKMCVDSEGTVLIAVDKTNTLADDMDCKCIRALSITLTDEKPACEINGNYSKKQCRRGTCRCVDGNGNQVCNSASCEVDEKDKDKLTCK